MLYKCITKIESLFEKIWHPIWMPIYKSQFRSCGNAFSYKKLKIHGAKRITIGNDVTIQEFTWIAAEPWTGDNNCQLVIGNHARIGAFNHIYATGSIIFEDNVLTANSVYITDNVHEYTDINTPIWQQPIKQLNKVVIGEGSWIGEHVAIIGASVGKHSVIGANAVVTHDIPDYCVAVGSPAKVIKQYDLETKKWIKI